MLGLAFGGVDVGAKDTYADPSPTIDPTPSAPDDCCDASQPQASHWDCKIGLNCGPIRPQRTWPPPPPPPTPPPTP